MLNLTAWWRRAALLIILVVVTYGAFLAYQQSTSNGRRLDQALTALHHANQQNDALIAVVNGQSQSITRLRRFLLAHGFTPEQVDALAPPPGSPGGPGPAGPPGSPGGPGSQPRPSSSPQPSHSPRPRPSPSPSPRDCAVTNPVDGACVVPCPISQCPPVPAPVPVRFGLRDFRTPSVSASRTDGLTASGPPVVADYVSVWLRAYLTPWLVQSVTPGRAGGAARSGGT